MDDSILGFLNCSIGRNLKVVSTKNVEVRLEFKPENNKSERCKLKYYHDGEFKSWDFLNKEFYKKIMENCGQNGHSYIIGKNKANETIKVHGNEFANIVNMAWRMKKLGNLR